MSYWSSDGKSTAMLAVADKAKFHTSGKLNTCMDTKINARTSGRGNISYLPQSRLHGLLTFAWGGSTARVYFIIPHSVH